jgi:hypothetical protein
MYLKLYKKLSGDRIKKKQIPPPSPAKKLNGNFIVQYTEYTLKNY